MIQALLAEVRSHGDRGAVVPFSRVGDLKNDMLELKNGEFHPDWLDRMCRYILNDANKFIPDDLGFTPCSLIVLAIPGPKIIWRFTYHGKPMDFIVPPHFFGWGGKNRAALRYLNEYLSPLGFSAVQITTITHKLLAVHAGLARYGRNNICYHDEFGSYMQIMTYVSDLPCDESAWFPLSRMEQCESCGACVGACPTGAIDPRRRLIDSDRCITRYNEIVGEFPEWMPPEAHNSIVGCTKCQDCCPANAHNTDNVELGVTFTEEETDELLNHQEGEPLPASLLSKIESIDVQTEGVAKVLPRNLSLLMR